MDRQDERAIEWGCQAARGARIQMRSATHPARDMGETREQNHTTILNPADVGMAAV